MSLENQLAGLGSLSLHGGGGVSGELIMNPVYSQGLKERHEKAKNWIQDRKARRTHSSEPSISALSQSARRRGAGNTSRSSSNRSVNDIATVGGSPKDEAWHMFRDALQGMAL